jgi:hypothetical protein
LVGGDTGKTDESRIEVLSQKITKLEQRIELLEKKLDVRS